MTILIKLASINLAALVAVAVLYPNYVASELDDQIQQLEAMMDRRPVIRLNGDKFKNFVGSQSLPRNYSFFVMMTALSPKRSCHICKQAYDEFVVTANSYKSSSLSDSKRIYFGLVDYDEGSDIFNSLNINSAPCFLYFNEKGNFRNPDELNIQRLGFGADVISRWISEKTGISIKIIRPPNVFFPIMLGFMALAFGAILYVSRHSLGVIFNRNVWALSAVALVLLMTSGQMWNHIRGAPLMQRGRGQNNYIHGSSSGQYIIETYLVMIINGCIGIGVILLTDALKIGDRSEIGISKKTLARAGFVMIIFFFSLLLSVFRQKSYGYPYRLLF